MQEPCSRCWFFVGGFGEGKEEKKPLWFERWNFSSHFRKQLPERISCSGRNVAVSIEWFASKWYGMRTRFPYSVRQVVVGIWGKQGSNWVISLLVNDLFANFGYDVCKNNQAVKCLNRFDWNGKKCVELVESLHLVLHRSKGVTLLEWVSTEHIHHWFVITRWSLQLIN